MVRLGFKVRPLRDGGGKPSPGRSPPPLRKPAPSLVDLGKKILQLATNVVDKVIESIHRQDKHHPFPPDLLEQVRSLVPGSHRDTPFDGQPFFLDHLRSMAEMADDPDSQYFEILKTGVPLGVKEPPLKSPGIWPTKEELKGESPLDGALEDPRGRGNYASAEIHSDDIRKTFLEERDMDMAMDPPYSAMETAHEEQGNSAQTAQSAAEPAKPEGAQDAGEQGEKGDGGGRDQNRHEDGGQEAAGSDSRATGTSQAEMGSLPDEVQAHSGEADKDEAKARVQQLQEQQHLQQQMQQRRARQVAEASQAEFTPAAVPMNVRKDAFVAASPPHLHGTMQPQPGELKVWDDFRSDFKKYMLHLSREALQNASAEADPRRQESIAPAVGGLSTGQVCFNLLNNACHKGARCVDRHPPRAQWKSWRQELKRKASSETESKETRGA
eukprot:symbB.v1.2.006400.t2/scaffold358.1/size381540/23